MVGGIVVIQVMFFLGNVGSGLLDQSYRFVKK